MSHKHNECLIEEVARVMAENPQLKAVTLDAEKKRISFALQAGETDPRSNKELSQLELQQLMNEYSSERLPPCINPANSSDCPVCKHGHSPHLPPGIRMVPMPGNVLLEKETCATAPRFWKWGQFGWIKFQVRGEHGDDHDHSDEWREALVLALICLASTIAGFALQSYELTGWALAAFIAAYISGAWHPAEEVWEMLREGVLDVHFLMLAVAAGAASIGHWGEGAILLFLFSFSGALEGYAMHRTRREISSLFHDAPKEAIVVRRNGEEMPTPVDQISTGMILRVRPGEQFPVDAIITDGATAADESNLTGEAEPVEKQPGDTVLSGTLNTWGRIDCRVLRPATESALSKIITLIREAQASKAPAQRFTDQFGSRYTYAILLASTVMFFVWWLGFGLPAFDAAPGAKSAFYNTMTLLVVASPCALVLSIPSAILAGIAAGARRGVLFRGGAAIEKLAEINRVALDKTGTLTTGELALENIESFPPGREEDILRLAAALAQNSSHPLSRAISRAAKERQLQTPGIEGFHSITGQGVAARLAATFADCAAGTVIKLARRSAFDGWMESIPLPPVGVTETVLETGSLRGRLLLRDSVRTTSKPLLEQLVRSGIHVTMLTGDRPEAAQFVADQVGLPEFRAGLKPEQKVASIEEWTKQGEKVAMIGDGVNDAPSLAAAYVGVGMGIRGSDAALEQADVVLMQDRLENFFFAYRLSQRAKAIIRQNLAISLGVIVVLVASALGAALPLTLGVFGHEGSTVLVVLNSLRLLFPGKDPA